MAYAMCFQINNIIINPEHNLHLHLSYVIIFEKIATTFEKIIKGNKLSTLYIMRQCRKQNHVEASNFVKKCEC